MVNFIKWFLGLYMFILSLASSGSNQRRPLV
jgi:hypothetical protein